MYVSEFWAGVFATLCCEFAALVIAAVIRRGKK